MKSTVYARRFNAAFCHEIKDFAGILERTKITMHITMYNRKLTNEIWLLWCAIYQQLMMTICCNSKYNDLMTRCLCVTHR